jgi:hypothetical protein
MHAVWQFIKDHGWMPFFFIANGIGVCMIPLGLPGIWFQFAAALAVTVLTAWMGSPHLGWLWTGAVLLIACSGEAVDFLFGNLGFTHTHGSALASWTALVFGFFFGFLGVFVPIPIPVIGSLIGSVIMSFVGTFAGAIVGEAVHQKRLADKAKGSEKTNHLKPALRVATGAVMGRALGIAAKLWFSFLAFSVAMAGLLWDIFMASR